MNEDELQEGLEFINQHFVLIRCVCVCARARVCVCGCGCVHACVCMCVCVLSTSTLFSSGILLMWYAGVCW